MFSEGDNGAIIHAGNNTPTSFSNATLTSSFTSSGDFMNNVSVTEMLPHTTVSDPNLYLTACASLISTSSATLIPW